VLLVQPRALDRDERRQVALDLGKLGVAAVGDVTELRMASSTTRSGR
jgi:hypothetical protein